MSAVSSWRTTPDSSGLQQQQPAQPVFIHSHGSMYVCMYMYGRVYWQPPG